MTAELSLVITDSDTGIGEPELVDELIDRADLDPEAQCLCALLWAPADLAARVVEVLRAGDFYHPAYGDLL